MSKFPNSYCYIKKNGNNMLLFLFTFLLELGLSTQALSPREISFSAVKVHKCGCDLSLVLFEENQKRWRHRTYTCVCFYSQNRWLWSRYLIKVVILCGLNACKKKKNTFCWSLFQKISGYIFKGLVDCTKSQQKCTFLPKEPPSSGQLIRQSK